MKHRWLVLYQILTGLSDTVTGLLLLMAPAFTLHLMHLRPPASDALIYLAYIGSFVFSVGVSCLYGARVAMQRGSLVRLETIWLLTSITRGTVAVFVAVKVLAGDLEAGWMTVALSDGALALVQFVGLARGWLNDAAL